MEGQDPAALAGAAPGAVLTVDRDDLVALEEGIRGEHRPGPPLAGKAVAGGHERRLAIEADPELAAGTGGLVLDGHGRESLP
jgi:hypothetical protein